MEGSEESVEDFPHGQGHIYYPKSGQQYFSVFFWNKI